jgi:hypothetical protein
VGGGGGSSGGGWRREGEQLQWRRSTAANPMAPATRDEGWRTGRGERGDDRELQRRKKKPSWAAPGPLFM